jgi:Secretion system C-terminal sorting domain
MKKILLFMSALTLAVTALPQELVVNGNLESQGVWQTASPMGGADEATFDFGYREDSPALGDGGCLAITGLGQTRCLAWQAVTITPGHFYAFSGAVKNGSVETVINTWVEVLLSRNVPDPVNDYLAGKGDYIYARNTWMAEPWNDMSIMDGKLIDESVFSWKGATDAGSDSTLTSETIYVPDTVTVTAWYVGLKAGIWNDVGGEPTFTYLFDNISLVDIGTSRIDEANMENPLLASVFPNPSTGNVKIILNDIKGQTYILYNQLGEVVTTSALKEKETLIDLSHMAKGIYFVRVSSLAKSEIHKLILQ